MTTDVPLACACGKLRGTASGMSPSVGSRVVCYCGDCQAFARFLGRPEIMNEQGGTDIVQVAPNRLRLTSGSDALGCVRLSDKGMHRWYCAECRTPIGNTLGPSVPFVGLIHCFIALGPNASARDDVLGPSLANLQVQSVLGETPVSGSPLSTLRVIGRSLRLLTKWWLTGAGSPSPFFDPKTGAPRVVPRVLSVDERRALNAPKPAR